MFHSCVRWLLAGVAIFPFALQSIPYPRVPPLVLEEDHPSIRWWVVPSLIHDDIQHSSHLIACRVKPSSGHDRGHARVEDHGRGLDSRNEETIMIPVLVEYHPSALQKWQCWRDNGTLCTIVWYWQSDWQLKHRDCGWRCTQSIRMLAWNWISVGSAILVSYNECWDDIDEILLLWHYW